MELQDVDKIVTTHQTREANKYLDDGYILLAVAGGKNEEDSPMMIYSLGRKKVVKHKTVISNNL